MVSLPLFLIVATEVNVNHRFNDLLLEVALFVRIGSDLQRTEQRTIAGATFDALRAANRKLQFAENRVQLAQLTAKASWVKLAPTAKPTMRIIFADMSAQALSGIAGINVGVGQTLVDQGVIANQNLLGNFQHQWIAQQLEPINDFVQGCLTSYQCKSKSYVCGAGHHDLFLSYPVMGITET